METIKINIGPRKVVVVGGSYGIVIPKAFFSNGLIDKDKKYKITMEEIINDNKAD